MQIFNEEIDEIFSGKDKFPNISSVGILDGVTTRSGVCCTFSAETFGWHIEQC